MKKLGIYIHIPFCIKKCLYCDFLSFQEGNQQLYLSYTAALIKELKTYGGIYKGDFTVDSIFFGGGTPSLLEAASIREILQQLRDSYQVEPQAEITMECNPKTLNLEKLEGYREAGVNRLSIGIQSFDEDTLKRLGRVHQAADGTEAIQLARKAGFCNINLDLMFAVPGHTLAIWQDTLDQALALNPEHLSFYSLQLEEGTPYFDLFEKGRLEMVSDEADRQMYHVALKRLEQAGYRHYEISNVGKPGFECRHNLKYWSMENYLGVGLGAHSYVEGQRFSNVRNLEQYLKALGTETAESDLPWVEWHHPNSQRDEMVEFMITGMRKREGISLAEFESRFGQDLFQAYPEQKAWVIQQVEAGMLLFTEGRLRFTLSGIDVSNTILAEFV
ncbi:oxygen-independent coproporphyrinogen III oxidase [Aminipila butyrica]|uniref:Heme chaperone HemW n=1 Tax=Aminipila butyrica TaxID=433296 RepID=A0A858BWM2_9FIRM|nr:radical SAM family heme chaperone HemW [Aminipila butyrica]QIB69579.1 oxygen-independent coproporphyrinogen III oxidase [Aminipila butyrica]